MKAVVWNGTGTLDLTDRPVPDPRPGWARVRVAAVGICGTDLHFFRGSFPSPAGLLPGHEVGGTVDALGEGVDGPATGTAVAVEPLTGCGTCAACRTGQANRCLSRTLFGISARGGLAEHLVVPVGCLHPLPDGLAPADGALAEPMAVCARGIRLGGVGLGDRVAVLGAGTIGLMAVLAARGAGAAEVRITARHPAQRAMAARFGALPLDGDGEPDRFDHVVETVGGEAETLDDAVALARPGGTITMLGVFGAPPRLPALAFSTKELRLVGSNCYGRAAGRSDFEIGIGLLARHAAQLRQLVTHRFALDQVNEAFAAAADKRSGSIKVHLTP